jgi:DNA-binding response OmpR family regulator
MRKKILVVEDEAPMQDFYRRVFEIRYRREFRWRLAISASDALDCLDAEPADILVLDWNLPDIPGVALLAALRKSKRTRRMSILMVSGRAQPRDAAAALELGADDYLAKPVDLKLFLAKLRSLARRREYFEEERGAYELPGLRLDLALDRLEVAGRPVALAPKELDLLKTFLRRPDTLLSHAALWDAVWGYDQPGSEHTLTALVSSLRRKLGAKWGPRLQASKARGYLFLTA